MKLTTLSNFFTEHYDISLGLTENDQAKYWLIKKYEEKVSDRLLKEAHLLREKARGKSIEYISDIISKPNPFLALLKKSPDFSGKYIPVPIIYGSNREALECLE